ncbi:collagen-like triple helix repeat-containing protein [Oligoflexus tunisiensis]|uniref:collagen-like triple helix repeat-containing protein n=1 Tax=Oligoflexus tunisiensis TaxID=708132 RepID=UPI000A5CDB82|nr:collagen-like protein [Oligoflexus tunisiensis]
MKSIGLSILLLAVSLEACTQDEMPTQATLQDSDSATTDLSEDTVSSPVKEEASHGREASLFAFAGANKDSLRNCNAELEGAIRYSIDDKTFYVCSNKSWAAIDLKGQDGLPGYQGAAGAKGDKGDKGATGATGPEGPQGMAGPRGERGEPGLASDGQGHLVLKNDSGQVMAYFVMDVPREGNSRDEPQVIVVTESGDFFHVIVRTGQIKSQGVWFETSSDCTSGNVLVRSLIPMAVVNRIVKDFNGNFHRVTGMNSTTLGDPAAVLNAGSNNVPYCTTNAYNSWPAGLALLTSPVGAETEIPDFTAVAPLTFTIH